MGMNDNPNPEGSRSQARRILEYMREGHTITPGEARRLFGSDRLGARIMDIERMVGYKPPRRLVQGAGLDPDGRAVTKRVMQYWLYPES